MKTSDKNQPAPEKSIPFKIKLKALSYNVLFILVECFLGGLLFAIAVPCTEYIRQFCPQNLLAYIGLFLCVAAGSNLMVRPILRFMSSKTPADILKEYQKDPNHNQHKTKGNLSRANPIIVK